MGVDPLAVMFDQQQLRQHLVISKLDVSPVTQLPHMVSHLVDTSTTFWPLNPCPAPASLQPEDLDTWDCSGQVLHA